ncbi:MAG: hypothetical protein RI953_1334 [Pseudomonadota bacterium]
MTWFLVLTVGLIGLAAFHSGEFASGFTRMMGDEIDVRFCTFITEHLYRALKGETEWLSPQMFYPIKATLGYSDALLLHFLAYAPIRPFVENPVSALQFSVIFLNFVTFVSTYLFMRRALAQPTFASLCGALFFSFNSAKFNQLNHIQLQPMFLVPLTVWPLWSFLKNMGQQSSAQIFKKLALAGLLLNIQLLTAVYTAWYLSFWIFLFLIVWALIQPEHRIQLFGEIKKQRKAIATAALVFVAGLIPFLLIYVPVAMETGTRAYGEAKVMIPRLQSLFWMDSTNYIWGWLAEAFPSFYKLPLYWEHRIGLGALITLSIPATCALMWRQKSKLKESFPPQLLLPLCLLTSVVCFYALGMIYFGRHSPWWVVYEFFPGASAIRAVARYALVTAFPIAILLTLGIQHILGIVKMNTGRTKWLTGSALFFTLTFLFAEQLGHQTTFSKTEDDTRISRLAARLPSECDHFFISTRKIVPKYMSELQVEALAIAMHTKRPTLNGYSGHEPKNWPLSNILAEDYAASVEKWKTQQNIQGKTCELSLD